MKPVLLDPGVTSVITTYAPVISVATFTVNSSTIPSKVSPDGPLGIFLVDVEIPVICEPIHYGSVDTVLGSYSTIIPPSSVFSLPKLNPV